LAELGNETLPVFAAGTLLADFGRSRPPLGLALDLMSTLTTFFEPDGPELDLALDFELEPDAFLGSDLVLLPPDFDLDEAFFFDLVGYSSFTRASRLTLTDLTILIFSFIVIIILTTPTPFSFPFLDKIVISIIVLFSFITLLRIVDLTRIDISSSFNWDSSST
jgi:hypothetical protein